MNPLQQMKQRELNWDVPKPLPRDYRSEEFIASYLSESPTGQARLMESILERNNMSRAIKRVIKNKGAPGVDGMTVRKLKKYFRRHQDKIEAQLLSGTYAPMPVRRKEISKPGGVRLLGIPTVLDRAIQQATAQVLTLIWDHTFSENSFGFRPERSQHDAIRRYREHVAAGKRWRTIVVKPAQVSPSADFENPTIFPGPHQRDVSGSFIKQPVHSPEV